MARQVRSDRARLTPADYIPDWIRRGGPGSGHFGHAGRPGQRGGSAPGDGETSISQGKATEPEKTGDWNSGSRDYFVTPRLLARTRLTPADASRVADALPIAFELKPSGHPVTGEAWIDRQGNIYQIPFEDTHDSSYWKVVDVFAPGHDLGDESLHHKLMSVRHVMVGGEALMNMGYMRLGESGGNDRGFEWYGEASEGQKDAIARIMGELPNGRIVGESFQPLKEGQILSDLEGTYYNEERIRNLVGFRSLTQKGGPGSGHFGHAGRPGQRGGSAPGDGDGETSISEGRGSGRQVGLRYEKALAEKFGEADPLTGTWIGPSGKILAHHNDHQATALWAVGKFDDYYPSQAKKDEAGYIATNDLVRAGMIRYNISHDEVDFDFPLDIVTPEQKDAMALITEKVAESQGRWPNIRVTPGPPFQGLKDNATEDWQAESQIGEEGAYRLIGLEDFQPFQPFVPAVERGGPGSGHFGHAGRPGQRGGSAPGDGETTISQAEAGFASEEARAGATIKPSGFYRYDQGLSERAERALKEFAEVETPYTVGMKAWLSPRGNLYAVNGDEHSVDARVALGNAQWEDYDKAKDAGVGNSGYEDRPFGVEFMHLGFIRIDVLRDEGYLGVSMAEGYKPTLWQAKAIQGVIDSLDAGAYFSAGNLDLWAGERVIEGQAYEDGSAKNTREKFEHALALRTLPMLQDFAAANWEKVPHFTTSRLGGIQGALWIAPDGSVYDPKVPHFQSAIDAFRGVGKIGDSAALAALEHGDQGMSRELMRAGFVRVAASVPNRLLGFEHPDFHSLTPEQRATIDNESQHAWQQAWTVETDFGGVVTRGGPGSGHFGHEGRPGQRGGSAPSDGDTSISESRPRVRPSDMPPSAADKMYDALASSLYKHALYDRPAGIDQTVQDIRESGIYEKAVHLWILPDGTLIRVRDHETSGSMSQKTLERLVKEGKLERTPQLNRVIATSDGVEAMYAAGLVRVFAFNAGRFPEVGVTVPSRDLPKPTTRQAEAVSDLYYRLPEASWQLDTAYQDAYDEKWEGFERSAQRWGLKLRAAPAPAFFYIPLVNEDGIAALAADIGRYLMRYSIEGMAVPQTDLHITLLYLDGITDEQMKQMLDGLALPLRFKVEVVGMERLGDALVLRLAPDPALVRLQRDLWMAAKRVGAQMGDFSNPSEFKPHISLAYDIPALLRLDDIPITQDNLNHCETWTVSCDTFAFGRDNGQPKRTVALPKTAGDRLFVIQGGPMVWPHISKPKGGIELTYEQWLAVMRGETVLTAGRRLVTRSMGPFVVKGGPGSGHFGHEGRPGQRGGSLPGEGGTTISQAQGSQASEGRVNAGVMDTIMRGMVKTSEQDAAGIESLFTRHNMLISQDDIAQGAEFWLAPSGKAYGVMNFGGHAPAATRHLVQHFAQRIREDPSIVEDGLRTDVNEGYNSPQTPAHDIIWESEDGKTTIHMGTVIGYGDWWKFEQGYGLMMERDIDNAMADDKEALKAAGGFSTQDENAPMEAVKAALPYVIAYKHMDQAATEAVNSETMLASLGFLRVSRGGTGGRSNRIGMSWDASLPLTPAQRDTLSPLLTAAQADEDTEVVYETVNNTSGHPGRADVARFDDDYDALWKTLEGRSLVSRTAILPVWAYRFLIQRGGPGSGHFGHEGRPGQRGGSLPGEQTTISQAQEVPAAPQGATYMRPKTGTTIKLPSAEAVRGIYDSAYERVTVAAYDALDKKREELRDKGGQRFNAVTDTISIVNHWGQSLAGIADTIAAAQSGEEGIGAAGNYAVSADESLTVRHSSLDAIQFAIETNPDLADIPELRDWLLLARERADYVFPLTEDQVAEVVVHTLGDVNKGFEDLTGETRYAAFQRYMDAMPEAWRDSLYVKEAVAAALSQEATTNEKILANMGPERMQRALQMGSMIWQPKSASGTALSEAVLGAWRSFAMDGLRDGSTTEARAALLSFGTYVMPKGETQQVFLPDDHAQTKALIEAAMQAPREDVEFFIDQSIAEAIPAQWIPPNEKDHPQMADAVNIAWRNIDMNTAKDALQRVAADIWSLDYQYKGDLAEPEGSDIAAAKAIQDNPAEAATVLTTIYDRTQRWFADRGYKPTDTVPVYRGVQAMTETWNPSMQYGRAEVRMWPLSSWTYRPSETSMFAKTDGAVIAARIPIKDIVAIADTGFPCQDEGELVVRGNPVAGIVMRPTLAVGEYYDHLLQGKALFVVMPDEAGDWIGQVLAAKGFKNRNEADAARNVEIIKRGGPGSGHFGHEGRPGQRGGSLPGEGGTSISEGRKKAPPKIEHEYTGIGQSDKPGAGLSALQRSAVTGMKRAYDRHAKWWDTRPARYMEDKGKFPIAFTGFDPNQNLVGSARGLQTVIHASDYWLLPNGTLVSSLDGHDETALAALKAIGEGKDPRIDRILARSEDTDVRLAGKTKAAMEYVRDRLGFARIVYQQPFGSDIGEQTDALAIEAHDAPMTSAQLGVIQELLGYAGRDAHTYLTLMKGDLRTSDSSVDGNRRDFLKTLQQVMPQGVTTRSFFADEWAALDAEDSVVERAVRSLVDAIATVLRGGPGSGHHGHAGIPGHRGGSLPGDNAGKEKETKPRAPRTRKPKPQPAPAAPPKPKPEPPKFGPRPTPTTKPVFKRMDVKWASSRKLLARITEDYARGRLYGQVASFQDYMKLADATPGLTAYRLLRVNEGYMRDIASAIESNIGHPPSQEEFETHLAAYMEKAAGSPYDRLRAEAETRFAQQAYEPKETRTMADLMVTPDSPRWEPVRAGFDAVDQVHVLPDLTQRILKPTEELGVPVVETRSGSKFGHYRGIADKAVNMAFNLSHPTAHPEMTVGHETGHMIDHIVFGVGSAEATAIYSRAGGAEMTETRLMERLGEQATPEVVSRLMDFGAVMDSIHNTPSYSTLRNFPPGTSRVTREDGSEASVYVSRGFVRYVSTNIETFARAYSQYITVRSGNENMRSQLGRFQQEARDGEIPLQWQDDEFKPVATAFDTLFRNRGWLK